MKDVSLLQKDVPSLKQAMFIHAANLADPDHRPPGKVDPNVLWAPNPPGEDGVSKQQEALDSEADILLYGGAAGGGKSDLLIGAAVTRHIKSIIFRREFRQARTLMERSQEIIGDHGRFNENLHIWRDLPNGGSIEFGGVRSEDDKNAYKGRDHDLKGFDELTEFTESQFRFLIAWTRTTKQGQRARVIATCNPPTDEEGSWIVRYWAPWLDPEYPNPAEPGEIRWFASLDGKDVEVESGEPFRHGNETIKPLSRTFIPALLRDNPHLDNTNYLSILQGLPEPLRTQLLHGDFSASVEPNPWQVVPTEWVRLAQRRWREQEKPDTPLTGVGIDPARGGKDEMVIAKRYDSYFDELVCYPGKVVRDGPTAALLTSEALKDEPQEMRKQTWYMNIDVIGWGSSAYDTLKTMYRFVTPINVAEGSRFRDKTKKFGMHNVRAEMYWRMREALDPNSGDDLAIPPGNEILADLCSATYRLTARGILVESKDDIRARLGRSPGKGEAILLAHMISDKARFWSRAPAR